jgi:hypothetical protein
LIAASAAKYAGGEDCPSVTSATNSSSLIGCTAGLLRRCSRMVENSSADRFLPHDVPAPWAGITTTASGSVNSCAWIE